MKKSLKSEWRNTIPMLYKEVCQTLIYQLNEFSILRCIFAYIICKSILCKDPKYDTLTFQKNVENSLSRAAISMWSIFSPFFWEKNWEKYPKVHGLQDGLERCMDMIFTSNQKKCTDWLLSRWRLNLDYFTPHEVWMTKSF